MSIKKYPTRYFGEKYDDPIHYEWVDEETWEIVGSGGCFVAGTQIMTIRGTKPIEKLKKEDIVVAFDRYGDVEHAQIKLVHVHTKDENNADIYTFHLDTGETLTATGNHGIYTGLEDEPFIQAQDFEVGMHFVNVHGDLVQIEKIDIEPLEDQPDDFKTYNLTVKPHHTYIANGIRVHNGGGGKGDQARAPVEGPNTLRSRAVAKVQEVVSEGEVEGLIDGGASVYFDDTPLENVIAGSPQTFTTNFENSSFIFLEGAPGQEPMPGFEQVESVTQVGVEVLAGTPIARAVGTGYDAVRVTVVLPAGLYTTDLTTGDINGSEVQIAIDRRLPAGTWEEVLTNTIEGKATAPYERAYRIEAPDGFGGGNWEVRVRRISANDTKSTDKSATFFSRFTSIQDVQVAYDDAAVVGIYADAKATGGNVPVRSYDMKGIKVQVPDNYNPITRAYTGSWGGTFQTAWTDNPAWIVYDLLTNERYGIGEYLDEATIDKFEFYDAAVYNDQLVDDGDGGTEPRYTFNAQIAVQEDTWKVIQQAAGVMRATVIPGPIVTLMQDRPSDPVKLITNANVEEGRFTYTGSALNTRKTVVHVTYNDPNDRYLPKVVSVADATAIDRYGFNPADIQAFATTSEGQARRFGKWMLETELNNSELCVWSGGLEQADLVPGDVVKIMDRDYVALELAGRIADGTTTRVDLDREVTLKVGATYTLTVVDEDAETLLERTVTTGAGSGVTSVSFSTPLPTSAANLKNNMWMLESDDDVVPRQFRVLNVKETEKGKFEVQALFYDPDKYARVESGIVLETPVYSDITAQVSQAVSNITFRAEPYIDPDFGARVGLTVRWDHNDDLAYQYNIQWRKDNGSFSADVRVPQKEYRIDNIVPGVYEVIVSAINVRGVTSPPVEGTFSYQVTGNNSLEPPINLQLGEGTGVGSPYINYTTNDLTFTWEANPLNAPLGGFGSPQAEVAIGQVAGYQVRILDNSNNELKRVNLSKAEATIGSPISTDFTYTYQYGENEGSIGGPHRQVTIQIYTRDGQGLLSQNALQRTFTNPAPDVLNNFDVSDGIDAVYITLDKPTDTDYRGIRIWGSTSSGFTPSDANLVFDGDSTFINISPTNSGFSTGDTVYFRAAAFDTFSKAPGDLNLTGEVSASILDTPGIPSGPTNPAGSPQPEIGDTFYNTTDKTLYTWNGTAWVAVGIRSVSSLPVSGTEGEVVFLTTDKKLYRWRSTGSPPGWVAEVDAVDIAGQITETQIEDDSISTPKLQALAVTTAKLDAEAVTADKILAGTITAAQIDSQTITASNIATGTITAAQIDTETITANEIASRTITADRIVLNSLTANEIATDAITTNELAANSITAAKGQISNLAVTTAKIADLNVTTLKIANAAVTNIGAQSTGSQGIPTYFSGTTNGSFPVTGLDPVTWVTLCTVPLTIDSTSSDIIIQGTFAVTVESGFGTANAATRGSEYLGCRLLRGGTQIWSGGFDIGRNTSGWVKDFAQVYTTGAVEVSGVSGSQTFRLQVFGQVEGGISNPGVSGPQFYHYQNTLVVTEVKR